MNKKKGFTLIELLVVIAIIALLLSILSPSLQKAKQNAVGVVCRSNLHQWYLCLAMYTKENNERIWSGWNPVSMGESNWWMAVMQPYYDNVGKIRCCPTATKPEWTLAGNEGPGWNKQPFRAWGHDDWLDPDDIFEEDPWGSYGINGWILDVLDSTLEYYNSFDNGPQYWRSMIAVKAPGTVPYMLDAQWIDGWPEPGDAPPKEEDTHWQDQQDSHFVRFVQNRHGRGQQNCSFMDGTARKVGLKELWTLKWHRGYDTRGSWTKAGGCTRARWENRAPWMAGFEDY